MKLLHPDCHHHIQLWGRMQQCVLFLACGTCAFIAVRHFPFPDLLFKLDFKYLVILQNATPLFSLAPVRCLCCCAPVCECHLFAMQHVDQRSISHQRENCSLSLWCRLVLEFQSYGWSNHENKKNDATQGCPQDSRSRYTSLRKLCHAQSNCQQLICSKHGTVWQRLNCEASHVSKAISWLEHHLTI